MIRQARTGDTVLAESREMTNRSQTLPWLQGGELLKTTEYIGHVGRNKSSGVGGGLRDVNKVGYKNFLNF